MRKVRTKIFSKVHKMIYSTVLISVLILEHFSSHVNCLTKTYFALNQWFENPRIWSARRLPCELDTVVLPDNVAMYLDRPISASKIILPKNGVLILDQKNWISEVNKNTCSRGQENKLVIRKNDWFDTNNWNVKYHTFELRGDDQLYNPVPHINRIPCQQDDVRFKPKTTFKVSINSVDKSYKLRNMFINNKKLISRDLERYTKSKIGKLQFNINGQFPFYTANTDDSSDHNVQVCQNNFNFFYNKICRNVVNRCPKLNCTNAIRPTGHCCDLCGSLISIEDKAMNSDAIENNLINIHLDRYDGVNFFMSKISEAKFEIILLDVNQVSRQSRTFAQEFVNFLKKENFYHSRTIEHQFSEYLDERSNIGRLVVIVTLLLFVCVFLFIYHENLNHIVPRLNSLYQQISQRSVIPSTDTPFTFIRFSSDHDDMNHGLEMETSQKAVDEFKLRTKNDSTSSNMSSKSVLFTVDEEDENISFDNPFFRKHSPSQHNILEEPHTDEEQL